MNKCEWCEEGRYTFLSYNTNETGVLYCLDLNKENDKYFMNIDRQYPPSPYWKVLLEKRIYYCPFCGRKLGEDK